MLKTKFPYVCRGGGGVSDQLPTFDPESKSAKNQLFLCLLGPVDTLLQSKGKWESHSDEVKLLTLMCILPCLNCVLY